MQAEVFARRALAHRRLADLREREVQYAEQEKADSAKEVERKGAVATAMRAELGQLDQQLAALMVERQLVVMQLTDACQAEAQTRVRQGECELRLGVLQHAKTQHHKEASRGEAVVAQLVPTLDISQYA